MKQAVLITWFSAVISLAISSLAVAALTPYSLAITFFDSETVEIPILLTADPGGEGLSVEPDLTRLPTPDLTGVCVPTTSQASEALPMVCLQPEPAVQVSSFQFWRDSGLWVQYRLTARPAGTFSGIRVSRSGIPYLIRLLSLFRFERERLASLQRSAPADIYKRDCWRTLKSPGFLCICCSYNCLAGGVFGALTAVANTLCSIGLTSIPIGIGFCCAKWKHRSFLPQWNLRLTVSVSDEMTEENSNHIRRVALNLIERGRAQLRSLEIDSTDQESESRQIQLEFRVYLPEHIQTNNEAVEYLNLAADQETISISREGTDVQPE